MEKRKFKVNYDQNLKESAGKQNSYTFVIPGSNLKDLHISIKNKEDPKKEKKKHS